MLFLERITFVSRGITVFRSVISELFGYLKRTTQTGHNASSASFCVNFRVYLSSKLFTIGVLQIRSNSSEILQYGPALCVPVN